MYAAADVPADRSVFEYLETQTADRWRHVVRSETPGGLQRFRIDPALYERLKATALEVIRGHVLHPWLTIRGHAQPGVYDSLSLTYNPQLVDPLKTDVHASSIGTSELPPAEFHYGIEGRQLKRKDSYFDTYGFRRRTPAGSAGAIGEFLAACALSPVRSRLSVISGTSSRQVDFWTGWHSDEPVHENVRLNIPIVSSPEFKLQIEERRKAPDPDSDSISTHYLEPGYAYTFDTARPHRVFCESPSRVDRVHLIFGFSPWFRYHEAEDAWSPNEHFGRVHPFEIFRCGLLHPGIGAEREQAAI